LRIKGDKYAKLFAQWLTFNNFQEEKEGFPRGEAMSLPSD
jgi:hypothetical protein